MIYFNKRGYFLKFIPLIFILVLSLLIPFSCSTFNYITYQRNEQVEDPEPNYSITLDPSFQQYTNFMFIGNRMENFGTYFNTFFNAVESYNDAYDDYVKKSLSHYSENLDSILISPTLSMDAQDNFKKTIEKASKVIQYHKSSAFMDKAVLLIGKSYYFLGGENYLKAERKFNEFVSKLQMSPLIDETYLYLAKTQLRLHNTDPALEILNKLINSSKNPSIVAESYEALAEYYISQKDYESAIKNYRKSLDLSSDNTYKAQLQFIIAAIIARSNPIKGSEEYLKVLDYSTTYDLEYLTRINSVKYKIIGNDLSNVLNTLDKLEVKYKDDLTLLPQILYLRGLHYEEKKDYKKEKSEYLNLIQTYPKTVASSDASFSLAKYYEYVLGDYLGAFRFYQYSLDESRGGHYYNEALEKSKIFKHYFDLRTIIAGTRIVTEYDSLFYKLVTPKGSEIQNKGNEFKGEDKGKGGGFSRSFFDSTMDSKLNRLGRLKSPVIDTLAKDTSKNVNTNPIDSLAEANKIADSLKIRSEKVLEAKFELSEIFIYDLNKNDSAEIYLKESYEGSDKPDFKCKVLFALANLYRSEDKNDKADRIFKQIINEYPMASLANVSRKLLGIPELDLETHDALDSVFSYGETKFSANDFTSALLAFQDIVSRDTTSKYYIRSAYAAGWIYENVMNKPDSALVYYSKLLNTDPSSDINKLITSKLTIYNQEKTKSEDSLSHKNDSLSIPHDSLSIKHDSSSINQDSLNNLPPGQKNEEIKKEEGDNSNINGNNQEKNKNGTSNPDIKKDEGTIPDPIKNK